MSPNDKLFLYALAVIAGGMTIAAVRLGWAEHRRKGQLRADRRYADLRFSPTDEQIAQRDAEYARYQAPSYLRTRAEESRLMPPAPTRARRAPAHSREYADASAFLRTQAD